MEKLHCTGCGAAERFARQDADKKGMKTCSDPSKKRGAPLQLNDLTAR
ncbi:hypothetical protein ALQ78_101398 [Pseudomonas syringae pv. aptata]|nr:hypothetical protein ALQ78_101398 [Pseudomonas syringae pv. aptata]